jgi:aryl-alcohol dehydrogenase-like predicted oxidoreductase
VRLVRLGEAGPEVSRVGLGCNNFGRRLDFERTREVVDAALEAGITFFDTADVYGDGNSERFLGEVLQGRRDRVVLATKFGHAAERGGSREHVHRAIDASLERLRTERVDLYYYHRPDGVTPLAETLGAMHELVGAGKVRFLGVSNFSEQQLREAHAIARANGSTLVALQNEYNLLRREAERDTLPACRELGIGFVPYFPLASGLLTGKYRRGERGPRGSRLEGRVADDVFDRLAPLEEFARRRGRPLLELAIAALASRAGVSSVIAGATSAEQVRANAAAAEWEVTQDELDELDALSY